jgi:hypothetical protein
MSDEFKIMIETAQITTQLELTAWLISNNIIRPAMDQRDGYVALNCYTGEPFTFQQLGATDGNNK